MKFNGLDIDKIMFNGGEVNKAMFNGQSAYQNAVNLIDNGVDYANWAVTGTGTTKSAAGIHLVNNGGTETAKLTINALEPNSLYELTINITAVNTTGTPVINSNLTGSNVLVAKTTGIQKFTIITKSDLSVKQLWFYISGGALNDTLDFEVVSLHEASNYAVSTTPRLIMTFDDAYNSVYTKAFPYMQTKGLKGTVFTVPTLIDTANFCTKAQLDEMYAAGWCIANHTYDHSYMNGYTKEQALDKVGACQTWLQTNGYLTGTRHLAYPGGFYNDDVIQALKELGIKTARTTAEANNGPVIPDLYKLNTITCGGGAYGLSQLQTLITNSISQGRFLCLMFHRIVATEGEVGTDGMNFLEADFQTLCDFIVTSGISDLTIDEGYETLTFKN